MKTQLAALTILLAALCHTSDAQTVWVVDDGGGVGVDFTDIQPAVDVAGPLDRIEVRPGSYSAVVVDGPVTILGSSPGGSAPPSVNCPSILVDGVAAGGIAVLVDLATFDVDVRDCAGTVILDGVDTFELRIVRSDDVRITRTGGGLSNFWYRTTMDVTDSFVQGRDLIISPWTADPDEDGRAGIRLTDSELILMDSQVMGQPGGDPSLCWGGIVGVGGAAVELRRSTARIVGCELEGGEGGYDCFGVPSFMDGPSIRMLDPTSAVVTSDTVLVHSVTGTGTWSSVPSLPWIRTTGRPVPGNAVNFEFRAAPTANLRLYLGREPVVVRVPWLSVPVLNTWNRGISLGFLPASGLFNLTWNLPALEPGTLIHVQTSATPQSGGATELSGACTLVVR